MVTVAVLGVMVKVLSLTVSPPAVVLMPASSAVVSCELFR